MVACEGGKETSENVSEVSEDKGYGPREITVNGVSLKEFTIVYCHSITFDGYNHYRLLVEEINAFLQEYCGYTLEAVPDTTPETENEILIGFTAGRDLRNAFDRESFEAVLRTAGWFCSARDPVPQGRHRGARRDGRDRSHRRHRIPYEKRRQQKGGAEDRHDH